MSWSGGAGGLYLCEDAEFKVLGRPGYYIVKVSSVEIEVGLEVTSHLSS